MPNNKPSPGVLNAIHAIEDRAIEAVLRVLAEEGVLLHNPEVQCYRSYEGNVPDERFHRRLNQLLGRPHV